MRLFRKHKESDHSATDEPGTSALCLKSLLRALRTTGLVAIKDMSEKEQRRVWDWSKVVIRKYRRTLERNPANIRPVEELPFPKEEIKLAIQLSLPFYDQKNIQSMVRTLKTSYKELGVFQSIEPEDKEKLRKTSGQPDKLSVEPYREGLEVLGKYMEMVISEKKVCLRKSTILPIEWKACDKCSGQRQIQDTRLGFRPAGWLCRRKVQAFIFIDRWDSMVIRLILFSYLTFHGIFQYIYGRRKIIDESVSRIHIHSNLPDAIVDDSRTPPSLQP